MIVVEVYVDDIIFGSDDNSLSQKISQKMQKEFELSILGELFFFLGLQISQVKDNVFHFPNYLCKRNAEFFLTLRIAS